MRILFTGAGSGGHLYPIVAVARQLKNLAHSQNIHLEMMFMGPGEFAKEVLAKENIKVKVIASSKIRRYFSLANITDIIKAPIGLIQALINVYLYMPDVVFSKGGYGSMSVVLASWFYRIPIMIHESDTKPGLANRLAVPFATRIAISFPITTKGFPTQKTAYAGHPVREEICQGDKQQGIEYFKLKSDKPVILAMGGSQGALAINKLILGSWPLLKDKYQIILVCGEKTYEAIKEKSLSDTGLIIHNFLDEDQMALAFAAADLIVSRAGSGSIFEIAACQKPSILVPLPGSAADHQRVNSFEYSKTGATVIIEEQNLTPHIFLREMNRIFEDKIMLSNMSKAANGFAKKDSANMIARGLLELAK